MSTTPTVSELSDKLEAIRRILDDGRTAPTIRIRAALKCCEARYVDTPAGRQVTMPNGDSFYLRSGDTC